MWQCNTAGLAIAASPECRCSAGSSGVQCSTAAEGRLQRMRGMLTEVAKLHRGDCVPRQTHSALQTDDCDCLINADVAMTWTETSCASDMKRCDCSCSSIFTSARCQPAKADMVTIRRRGTQAGRQLGHMRQTNHEHHKLPHSQTQRRTQPSCFTLTHGQMQWSQVSN